MNRFCFWFDSYLNRVGLNFVSLLTDEKNSSKYTVINLNSLNCVKLLNENERKTNSHEEKKKFRLKPIAHQVSLISRRLWKQNNKYWSVFYCGNWLNESSTMRSKRNSIEKFNIECYWIEWNEMAWNAQQVTCMPASKRKKNEEQNWFANKWDNLTIYLASVVQTNRRTIWVFEEDTRLVVQQMMYCRSVVCVTHYDFEQIVFIYAWKVDWLNSA